LREAGAEVTVSLAAGGNLTALAGRATTRVSLLVSVDGEVVRLQTPLDYRSRPGALVVIAPRVN
jgi:diacylglycerol kinase family enzyme